MSFGFGSGFGASSNPFGTTSPSPFGQSTSTFGQNTSPFGSTSTTGVFGQSQPAFGASTPAFGAAATPAFGAASTPAFGASAFGAKPASTGFGFGAAPSASAFGAPAQSASAFGAPAQSTPAFGAPSSSVSPFGGTSAFGQAPTTAAFGSVGFGQQQQQQALGAPAGTTAFGAPQQQTPFGAPAPAAGRGSRAAAWRKTQETDTSSTGTKSTVYYNSISCMPEYANKSAEELRWEDYEDGVKGGTGAASPGGAAPGGLFGQPSAAPSPFGGAAQSVPAFGAASAPAFGGFSAATSTPAFGGFGAASTPAFGAASSSAFGGFGAATSTPAFGATPAPASTPAFGGFGAASTPAFGATPAASAPAFGAFGASSTPGFGAAPAASAPAFSFAAASTPAFGAASSTSLFGAASAPAFGAASTPSLFGAASAQKPLGAPAFGAPGATPAAGGAFGFASTPAFGATPAASTPAFGASTGGGLFGAASTPAFGTPGTGGGLFGTAASQPSTSPFTFAPAASTPATGPLSLIPATAGGGFPSAAPQAPAVGVSPYGSLPDAPKITPLPEYKVGLTQRILAPSSGGPPRPIAFITPRSLTPLLHGGKLRPRARAVPPSGAASSSRLSRNPAEFFAAAAAGSNGDGLSGRSSLESPAAGAADGPSSAQNGGGASNIFVPRDNPRKLFIREPLPSTEANGGFSVSPASLATRTAITPGRNGGSGSMLTPGSSGDGRQHMMNLLRTTPPEDTAKGRHHHHPMSDTELSSILPVLCRPEYYTEPSLTQLAAMARDDPDSLAEVAQFTVGKRGVGSVRWLDPVDVRGINIDEIVELARGSVEVYLEGSDKPDVGSGLNKSAEITMLKIFKTDTSTGKPTQDPEAVERFTRKLKKIAAEQSARFISYDGASGTWKFEVEHFSKYGLVNGSDDEDQDTFVYDDTTVDQQDFRRDGDRNTQSVDAWRRGDGSGQRLVAHAVVVDDDDNEGVGVIGVKRAGQPMQRAHETVIDDQERGVVEREQQWSRVEEAVAAGKEEGLGFHTIHGRSNRPAGSRLEQVNVQAKRGLTSGLFGPVGAGYGHQQQQQRALQVSLPERLNIQPEELLKIRGGLYPSEYAAQMDQSKYQKINITESLHAHPTRSIDTGRAAARSHIEVFATGQMVLSQPSSQPLGAPGALYDEMNTIQGTAVEEFQQHQGISRGARHDDKERRNAWSDRSQHRPATSLHPPRSALEPPYSLLSKRGDREALGRGRASVSSPLLPGTIVTTPSPSAMKTPRVHPMPGSTSRSPCLVKTPFLDDDDGGMIMGTSSLSTPGINAMGTAMKVTATRLAEKSRCLPDSGLFLGQTSRVGWAPNGVLCSHTAGGSAALIAVKKISLDEITHCQDEEEAQRSVVRRRLESQLKLHFQHSRPVFVTPPPSSGAIRAMDGTTDASVSPMPPMWELRCQRSDGELHRLTQEYIRSCNSHATELTDPDMSHYRNILRHQSSAWDLIHVLFSSLPAEEQAQEERAGTDRLGDAGAMLLGPEHQNTGTDDTLAPAPAPLSRLALMQRRAALSRWLKDRSRGVTERTVLAYNDDSNNNNTEGITTINAHRDGASDGMDDDTAARILALLSGYQLGAAAALAAAADDVRLSTLISSAGLRSAARDAIAAQLVVWEDAGFDQFIQNSLLQVYHVLAGHVSLVVHSMRSMLDWRRALGMHLWYGASPMQSVGHVVEEYAVAVKEAKVPVPVPPYYNVDNGEGTLFDERGAEDDESEKIYDVNYELLRLYAAVSADNSSAAADATNIMTPTTTTHTNDTNNDIHRIVPRALRPAGTTPDPLDHSFSWHMLCTLRAINVIPPLRHQQDHHDHHHRRLSPSEESSAKAQHLATISFLSQLESVGGLFHWTIYVALTIPQEPLRVALAKDLLARHCSAWCNDAELLGFLLNDLLVPKEWLAEARALWASYRRDPIALLEERMESGEWAAAHAVLCKSVAPAWLLAGGVATAHLAEVLAELESVADAIDDVAGPGTYARGAGVYASFLLLRDIYASLGIRSGLSGAHSGRESLLAGMDAATTYEERMHACEELSQRLNAATAAVDGASVPGSAATAMLPAGEREGDAALRRAALAMMSQEMSVWVSSDAQGENAVPGAEHAAMVAGMRGLRHGSRISALQIGVVNVAESSMM